MNVEGYSWKLALSDLFGGTVNQQTLEEAADLMVSVSIGNFNYHMDCISMLDSGLLAAKEGDSSLIDCINKSGYKVSSAEEAGRIIQELREIYMDAYNKSI